MSRKSKLFTTLLISNLLLFGSYPEVIAEEVSPSQAQARRGVLDEVIVTARRREEALQDTPVAITSMSGDDLRDAGILNARDLANFVPSLQINEGVSNQIFIRGVGERTGFARIDPAVGVYIDDIFLPRVEDQLLDAVDVQSVQVLRGPQGTLFGKNNTGGAIVFALEKPHEELSGYVEAGLGNFNAWRARTGINLPISEGFYARLSLNTVQRDGYMRDLNGSRNQSDGRISAMLQMRYVPTADFTVDTLLFYGRTREKMAPVNCRVANKDALLNQGIGLLWPGDTDPANPRAYTENCEANSRDNLPDLTTNMGSGANLDKNLDLYIAGVTADWAYHEDYSLKAILGLRLGVKRPGLEGNNDGGPQSFMDRFNIEDSDRRSASIEIQWHGSLLEQRLKFTSGLFAMVEQNNEETLSFSPIGGIDATSLAQLALGEVPDPPPPGGTHPPLVGGLMGLPRTNEFDLENRTLAVFFQGTYNLRENLELTAGARYTWEERVSRYQLVGTDMEAFSARLGAHPRFVTIEASQGLHAFLGTWSEDPISIANSVFEDETGDGYMNTPQKLKVKERKNAPFREFTPMLSLTWFAPDDWLAKTVLNSAMIYGTLSRGFKAGLFEPVGADGLQKVKPETLQNREVGLKIEAFERRFSLNLAGYSMLYNDMQTLQVGIDSEGTGSSVFENASEARIDGFEAEFRWLPIADLLVTASYSFNRYRFLEWEEPALVPIFIQGETVMVDRSDEAFTVSPEQTASLSIQYSWQVDIGSIIPRIDIRYTDDIYLGFDRNSWEVYQQDPSLAGAAAYTLADFRLSWQNPAGDVTATAYVKNAFDKRYLIGNVSVAGSVGNFTEVVGAPRMYGMEIRKTF